MSLLSLLVRARHPSLIGPADGFALSDFAETPEDAWEAAAAEIEQEGLPLEEIPDA